MKSFVGILVVCFLSLSTAYIIPKAKDFPAVFLPNGKCPPVDGEYPVLLPDTEDPTIFYICSFGIPVQKKCPLGLIFNPLLQVCDRPKNDFQHPKTSSPVGECPPIDPLEPVYLEDSENSTVFYECSNGIPWKHVCPRGLIFNITLKVCVFPKNDFQHPKTSSPVGECPPVDSLKPVYLEDSENSTIFYECSNGKPIKLICPHGLIFDITLEVCVFPKNDFQHPKTSSPVGECPPVDSLKPVYLEDSENSTIFYECSNGKPIKIICPHGLIFDITLEVCVRREFNWFKNSVISFLPVGQCPPVDGEFPVFLPDDKDNTIYYECNHGFPIKMKCPANLIFDPKLNVCVRKE